ncbi:MAG: YlzJ-like family protein [Actinomycetia bacterium]|nr:YlzJ-like family protein [Actinomycetes bacterium]
MILYTPLAPEDVFGWGWGGPPGDDRLELEDVAGRPCLVRTGADGRRRLERLLSTDPRDFLDPRFAPGRLVP